LNGLATDAVTLIPSVATADRGFTQEIIEMSTTTHLPVRVLGYEGPTLCAE
jgi:hypothetical protein